MAYYAGSISAKICLYPFGRKPERNAAKVSQYDSGIFAEWTMAWRQMDFYHWHGAFAMRLYDCWSDVRAVDGAMLPDASNKADSAGFAVFAKSSHFYTDYDWICTVSVGFPDYGRRDLKRNVSARAASRICRRDILFRVGNGRFCDFANWLATAFFDFPVAGEERRTKNSKYRRNADDGMFCNITGDSGIWLLWEGI